MRNCGAANEQTRLRLLIRAGCTEKRRTTPSFIPINAVVIAYLWWAFGRLWGEARIWTGFRLRTGNGTTDAGAILT